MATEKLMHPEGCSCCAGPCCCDEGAASSGMRCEMCWACNIAGCDERGRADSCPARKGR